MTTLAAGAAAAAVVIACSTPLYAADQRKPDAVARTAPAEKTGAATPQRTPGAVATMEAKRGSGPDPNITESRAEAMKSSEGMPAPPHKRR